MARTHKIHPSILPINTFKEIMGEIGRYHSEYQLPLKRQDARIDQLENVITTRLAFRENTILIELTIPVTPASGFELFKLHPVPVLQANGMTAYIKPRTDYLAMRHDKRAYVELSERQVQDCRDTEIIKLCYSYAPLMAANNDSSCEFKILTNPALDAFTQCEIRVQKEPIVFTENLGALHSWLISLPYPLNIRNTCPGENPEETTVDGALILYIRPTCSVHINGFSLIGRESPFDFLTALHNMEKPELALNLTAIDRDFDRKIYQLERAGRITFKNKDLRFTGKLTGISFKEIQERRKIYRPEERNK